MDAPTLPVNPAHPRVSMILLGSDQASDSLEYQSWFQRGGQAEDHRRVSIELDSIPPALVLFGSFDVGGSEGECTELDDSE